MKTKSPLHRIAALFALALLSTFAAAHEAKAQTTNLVTYNFTGAAGNQATQPTSSVADDISASVLGRGPGINAGAANNSISASGWTTAASVDLDDYYTFTLTPDADYNISLGTLSFAERRSNTGPRNLAIRTSLDAFSADIFTATWPDNDSTRNQSFNFATDASFSNITNAITIRIYAYAAEGTSGTWRLANTTTGAAAGNMRLTGTVTATGPSSGNYWAPGASGGGNGNWGPGNNNWATGDKPQAVRSLSPGPKAV